MVKLYYACKAARAIVLSAAVVLVSGAGFSLANFDGKVSVSGGNDTTGFNSVNENLWELDFRTDLNVLNQSRVDNIIDQLLNTGENRLRRNTEGGSLRTGDIRGRFDVENELNAGEVSMGSHSSSHNGIMDNDHSIDLGNTLTGFNSANSNLVNIDSRVKIDINNEADVINNALFDLNTGRNNASRNTVGGDVRTGSVDVDFSTENVLNENTNEIDLEMLMMPAVDTDFENSVTGAQSENTNELNLLQKVNVNIQNTANIDNNLDVEANTGLNEVERNTVVGDVTTGDVSISASVTNIAN